MKNDEDRKNEYKQALIEELKKELEGALAMDISCIAARIEEIGFSCLMCGKCCMKQFGDNSVFVTPKEINRIAEGTGLTRDEIVDVPLPEENEPFFNTCDVDSSGDVHTFGWILRHKGCGDCRFIRQDRRCEIYDLRPMLCRTYPFYIYDGTLKTSQCEGLGARITKQESIRLADDLIKRYISELRETQALYENYQEFSPDMDGFNIARKRAEKGIIFSVVHDGQGSHPMVKNIQR